MRLVSRPLRPPRPERDAHATATFGVSRPSLVPDIRRFRLRVVDGPGRGADVRVHRRALLHRLAPAQRPRARRPHRVALPLRARASTRRASGCSDLGSRNGTIVDGVRCAEALLRGGSLLAARAASALRFELGAASRPAAALGARRASARWSGARWRCATCFALLERAAASRRHRAARGRDRHRQEQAARGHPPGERARATSPFLVVDCGAHPGEPARERAVRPREGRVHRRADAADRRLRGGPRAAPSSSTRLASCPLELQPKLLRVLESARDPAGRRQHATRPSTCASSPPPTATCAPRSTPAASASDLYFRLAVVQHPAAAAAPARPRTSRSSWSSSSAALGADAAGTRRSLRRPAFLAELAARRVAGQRARAAQPPRALRGPPGALRRARARRRPPPVTRPPRSTRASPTPRRGGARSTLSSAATWTRCSSCTAGRCRRRRRPRTSTACTSTG